VSSSYKKQWADEIRILGDRKIAEGIAWTKTHRDYKTIVDGKKSILLLRNGGTTLVPIASLSDSELSQYLQGY
jgi:hypothetical protein